MNRDAIDQDFAEIARLYSRYVLDTAYTFEDIPPSVDELLRRFHANKARGLPARVSEAGFGIDGFAYASPYHERHCYRFTVQVSLFVDEKDEWGVVGESLLSDIIRRCGELGYAQILAVVGDTENEPYLNLFARMGFRTIGQALRVGSKFGRWVDIVLLQYTLIEADIPPSDDPAGYHRPLEQTGP